MDGKTFDDLTRAAGESRSRRGAVGLLAAALATVTLSIGPAAARKKRGAKGNNRNKKRCRKLGQGCGKKKRCCEGLICADGVCACPSGTVQSNGSCVPAPPPPPPPPPSPPPPPAPECRNDGDCGAKEICQNGACVPEPPECVEDNDCGNNEICQNNECVPEPECDSDGDCGDNEACQDGICFCPEAEDGRCIRRCELQDDCPGVSSCRNLSPETSFFIEDGVCVDEAFFLCDVASCTVNNNCDNDEVCVMLSCEGDTPVGRCHPFSVFALV